MAAVDLEDARGDLMSTVDRGRACARLDTPVVDTVERMPAAIRQHNTVFVADRRKGSRTRDRCDDASTRRSSRAEGDQRLLAELKELLRRDGTAAGFASSGEMSLEGEICAARA